jgi:hypothetical protein
MCCTYLPSDVVGRLVDGFMKISEENVKVNRSNPRDVGVR